MKDTAKNTEGDKNPSDKDKDKLGISRGIYAAGHSYKDGVIWGLIATGASIAVLMIGRKKSPLINTTANTLEEGHASIKRWMAKAVQWSIETVGRLFGKANDKAWKQAAEEAGKFATKSSTTAAGVIVGAIVGHAVQVPAAVKGWRIAETAVKQYDNVVDEKNRLADANITLTRENQSYKAALARKDAGSFVDRAQKSDAEESVLPGH